MTSSQKVRRYALKFLSPGAVGPYSGFSWPVPNGKPGKWVSVSGDLEACENGIHATTFANAVNWLREECYVIELSGVIEAEGKLVARKGRLIRRVDFGERELRLFAADCAAHVLKHFESRYPDDKRPREAINAARRYARRPSDRNRELMLAARDAARDAAWDAGAAARAAARDAARAAAWDAARDAAWDAARAAARDAAWDAARDAARAAAWDAAWDAARAAARAAADKKLAPVKAELQQSALALIERMIAATDQAEAA